MNFLPAAITINAMNTTKSTAIQIRLFCTFARIPRPHRALFHSGSAIISSPTYEAVEMSLHSAWQILLSVCRSNGKTLNHLLSLFHNIDKTYLFSLFFCTPPRYKFKISVRTRRLYLLKHLLFPHMNLLQRGHMGERRVI